MDIQSLASTLAQQLANSGDATKQAEKLLALEARSGTLLQALVTEVVNLSAREQQNLLQQLKQELAQQIANQQAGNNKATPGNNDSNEFTNNFTNKAAAETTPALAKHIASLQARIALLGSAEQNNSLLQLVSLKLGLQQVKTLSNLPLHVGAHVNLRVRADGQLDLLAQRKAENTASQNPARDLRNDLKLIAESLREHLPRSAEKIQSVQTLDRLVQTLRSVDTQISKLLLPESTQKLLAQLIANTLKPQATALTNNYRQENNFSANQIKQAVIKSGGVLESSLRKLLPALGEQSNANIVQPGKNSAQAQKSDGFNLQAKILGLLAGKPQTAMLTATHQPIDPQHPTRQLAAIQNATQATSPGFAAVTPTNANNIDEDNKAILLKLLQQLNTNSSINDSNQQRMQRALQDPLIAVLRSLGLKPDAKTSTQNLQREVVAELKQLVASTLARIQTLQLRSLNQGLNDRAAALMPAVELSIRVNDNIYPLVIYFQEKAPKEKLEEDDTREQDKRKRKLARQWKVFMQFEMDDCGWFASEVSLLEEKVSTRFWAERNATKTLMKSRLDALKQKMEASGLDVEDIQLLAGEPPVPNTSVQQNLVDIQT